MDNFSRRVSSSYGMPSTHSLMQDLLDTPCRLNSDSRYSLLNNYSNMRKPRSLPPRPPVPPRPPAAAYPRNVTSLYYSNPPRKVENYADGMPNYRRDLDAAGMAPRIHNELRQDLKLPQGNNFRYDVGDYNSRRSFGGGYNDPGIASTSNSGRQYHRDESSSMQEVLNTSDEIKYFSKAPKAPSPSIDGDLLMENLQLLQLVRNLNKLQENEREKPKPQPRIHASHSAVDFSSFRGKVSEKLQADQPKYKYGINELLSSKEVSDFVNTKQNILQTEEMRAENIRKTMQQKARDEQFKYLDTYIHSSSRERSPARYRNRSPEAVSSWRYSRSVSRSPDRYGKMSPYNYRRSLSRSPRYRTKYSRDMSPRQYRSSNRERSPRWYRSPSRERSPRRYRSPRRERSMRTYRSPVGYRSKSSTRSYRSRSPRKIRSPSPRRIRSPSFTSNSPPRVQTELKPSKRGLDSFPSNQLIGALHLVDCAIKQSFTHYLLNVTQKDVPVNLGRMARPLTSALLREGFELKLEVVSSLEEQNWRDPVRHLINFALENECNHEIYLEARAHEDEIDIRYAKPFELAEYIRGSNVVIAFLPLEALAEKEKAGKKKKKKQVTQPILRETQRTGTVHSNIVHNTLWPLGNRLGEQVIHDKEIVELESTRRSGIKSVYERLGKKVQHVEVINFETESTPWSKNITERLGTRVTEEVPLIYIDSD